MFDFFNFLLKILLGEFLFCKSLVTSGPISTQLAVLRIESLILDLNCVKVFSDYFTGALAPFLRVKLFNLIVGIL